MYEKDSIFLECTQLLLEHGADPNIQADRLSTPLHLSALNRDYVKLLLKYGVDPSIRNNCENNCEETPLYMMAFFGKTECLKLCIEYGRHCAQTYLNNLDNRGTTALHLTAFSNKIECTQWLLDYNVPITKDHYGRTAKSIAKERNHHNIVDLIDTYELKRIQSGIQKLRALNLHYKLVSLWREYWYERVDENGYNRHQWYMVKQDLQHGFIIANVP
jgi:ankyrin repeat protein